MHVDLEEGHSRRDSSHRLSEQMWLPRVTFSEMITIQDKHLVAKAQQKTDGCVGRETSAHLKWFLPIISLFKLQPRFYFVCNELRDNV